jgi:hypothetical protein
MSDFFLFEQEEQGCNDRSSDKQASKRIEYRSRSEFEDDADIAKEIQELTMQEREKVMEDIHAVAEAQEETEELLEKSLAELDTALRKLPQTVRRDFDRAVFLKPDLEQDTEFKLRFLRTDFFHAGLAARRMAGYFTKKVELFGDEKLAKKITLEDLDERDLAILQSGMIIKLPSTDPIGRPITFCDSTKFNASNGDDSMVRRP